MSRIGNALGALEMAAHLQGAREGLVKWDSRWARERKAWDGLLRKMDLCEMGRVDPRREWAETQGQA